MSYELHVFKLVGTKPDAEILGREFTEVINARRVSVAYENELDKAAEIVLTLSNRDLYFLMPDKGAKFFQGLTLLTFQYGYEDPNGIGGGTRLSPWHSFPFSAIDAATEDQIVIKFISPSAQKLTTISQGAMLEGQKISEVVTSIASQLGFDKNHRVIQDSTYRVANLLINGQDTFIWNLLRIGKKIGYVYYEDVHPTDGKPVFHFHKRGYVQPQVGRATTEGTVPVTRKEDRATKYGEDGADFFTKRTGVLSYQPIEDDAILKQAPNTITDIKSFTFRYESDSVPAKVSVKTIDLTTGKVPDLEVFGEKDLPESEALAKKTPFDEPQNDGFLQRLENFFLGAPAKKEPLPEDLANARVSYVDRDDVPGGQTLVKISHASGVQPKEQADEEAKAALTEAQAKTTVADVTFTGYEKIRIGQVWFFQGFGIFDGDYLIRRVRQEQSTGGYITTITATTDGIDAVIGTKSRSGDKKEQEREAAKRIRYGEIGELGIPGVSIFSEPSEEP